jgi:hypothetical protein
MSTDPESRGGFGPYLDGVGPTYNDKDGNVQAIRFGNIKDLECALDYYGKNVAAFLVEPIQGEAGYVHVSTVTGQVPSQYAISASSFHQGVTCKVSAIFARKGKSSLSATRSKQSVFVLLAMEVLGRH